MFRSFIHLLVFMYGVEEGSDFIFLHMDIKISQHLLKDCPFLINLSWHHYKKLFDHVFEGSFLGSLFHLLPFLSLCQYAVSL